MNSRKRRLILGLFLVTTVIQIAIPASMIVRQEMTISEGTVFKFRCGPIDPYDPFRGRYMAINILENEAPLTDKTLRAGDVACAIVENGADGFAHFTGVQKEKPNTSDYIRLKVRYVDHDSKRTGARAHLDLPFDRYYLNEKIAPKADELLLGRNMRDLKVNLSVRVNNGQATPVQLYVDSKKIEEYVRSMMN